MVTDDSPGSTNNPIVLDDSTVYTVEDDFLDDDFFVDDSNRTFEKEDYDAKPVLSQPSFRNVYTSTGTLLPKSNGRGAPVCFNCDGKHILAKCPFPKDNKKIKTALSLNRNKRNNASNRYHDEANESKYTPGELSKELREALDIDKYELPPWIHRMRVKGLVEGYPPELLLDALENDEETLDFHAGNDNDESCPIPSKKRKINKEDNEDLTLPPKINPNKIFDIPGYNKYIPNSFTNSGPKYRVPHFGDFIYNLEEVIFNDFCQHYRIDDYELAFRHRRRREKNLVKTENKKKESRKSSESSSAGEYDNSFQDDTVNRSVIEENSGTIVINSQNHFQTTTDDKPSLENFTVGIQPFEAREEAIERGFLKKIRSLIKKN
uniref:PSP domain-containing protein n=1 Tax=Strongyloides stercoralis TaxID=6248 RepID=A0A0K0DWD4_STRER